MTANGGRDCPRLRHLRSGCSALTLLLATGGLVALSTAPGLAACTVAGDTLTCTGDLSAGVNQSSATVTTVNINSLTQDIGTNGVRFRNTAGLDVAFDVNLLPHAIVLNPSTAPTARNGFHIITDGAISGTLVGNITGPVLPTVINPSGTGLNNFAVLGLDAETGIDVTHDGDIDATFSDVVRTGTSRGDISSGRFAAVRAEINTGDIAIDNIGAISLEGVTRIATVENTTGGTAGARALQFSNALSENHGFHAQGNGDLTFNQVGDITITGGGALVTARTDNNTAEAGADFAQITGIDIPYFTSVGGVFNPNLPRFDDIVLDIAGLVSVTGGDIEVVAEAASTGAGQPQGSAVARTQLSFSAGDLGAVRVGRGTGHGGTADVSIVGDVAATGGSATAIATASLGGAGQTAGLALANATGQDTTGVSVGVNSSSGGGGTGTASLIIDGDVVVVSGGAYAEATGTGTATRGTLYSDDIDFTPSIGVTANPGTAGGVGVSGAALGLIDINGTIDVRSGDAFTRVTGSDMRGFATGRAASGLSIGADTDFTTSHDMPILVRGGNSEIALDGARISGYASGSGAGGASILGRNRFSHTHTGEITVQGGNAVGTALNGAAVEFGLGGGATGIEITPFGPDANGTLFNQATILVTGGNATASGPALDLGTEVIGGGAFGIFANTFVAGSFASIQHDGLIVANGGNGDDAQGRVNGIVASDQGAVQIATDGSEIRSSSSITVTGQIEIEGEGTDQQFIFDGAAAGVLAQQTGTATISIGNGGGVEAIGARVHGLSTFANQAFITVENGAEVSANGPDAHGIFLRSYSFDFASETRSSTNLIVIENGATVTSAQGNAIRDLGVFTFTGRDFQTGAPTDFTDGVANATTVDLAGTVTGGNGTAIDLGDGDDSLFLRSSAIINGGITLGSGNDRFSFEEGFTVSSPIDGGAGEDAVVADVAAGATRTLDVGAQPVTGLEVIEKLGVGTLVLDGATLPTPYRLDVLAGLTTFGRDFTNLSAGIASGARVRNDVVLGGVTTQGTGILSGNGTIASLINNGVISPGNSIGTITVAGDASFNAGSVYEVEIEAPDQSDRIDVGGTATINGGGLRILKLSLDDDYEDGQTYRIINAGDVDVTSAFVFDQPLSLLRTDVAYGDSFVDLRLTADIPLTTLAQTFNQTQAATGLQDMSKIGDGLTVFNEILQLSLQPGGENAVRRAFDLASGEVHASAQHLVSQGYGLFNQTMMQQGKLPTGPNGGAAVPLGYAPIGSDGSVGYSALGYSDKPAPRSLPSGLLAADTPDRPVDSYQARLRSAWVAPLGARGSIDGDGNAGTLDWWSGGLAGGMSGALDIASGQAHAGFAVGYIRSRGTVDARLSSVESDGFHIGAHVAWADGPWSLSGAVGYAAHSVSTKRRIIIGGIDRTAEASYWTHTLGLSGELAYRIETGPATTIAPLATLDAAWSGHGGFTETGAGAANLTGAGEDWTRFDTGLGVAFAHTMVTETGPVTLEGRAVWEHAFGDVVPDQALSFAGSPTGFTVRGPDAGRDRLRLGAGLSFAASDTLTIRARYDGVFSSRQSSHGASLGFSKKF